MCLFLSFPSFNVPVSSSLPEMSSLNSEFEWTGVPKVFNHQLGGVPAFTEAF
jgi:hypothetical protein